MTKAIKDKKLKTPPSQSGLKDLLVAFNADIAQLDNDSAFAHINKQSFKATSLDGQSKGLLKACEAIEALIEAGK